MSDMLALNICVEYSVKRARECERERERERISYKNRHAKQVSLVIIDILIDSLHQDATE